MNVRETARAKKLEATIRRFQGQRGPLPGLAGPRELEALIAQLIDSLRRVEFAQHLANANHSPLRTDPTSAIFDPYRAAVLWNRKGEPDEAWWLVFLGTHFGKHAVDGWCLARDVYGRLGQGGRWDWPTLSSNPANFTAWLSANEATLRGADGVSRRFSNHRKYESLSASSTSGTSAVFASYVAWIKASGTAAGMVRHIHQTAGQNPQTVFAELYASMAAVKRFGRLGKFDFLAMLGKLGIAPIEPGSAFLHGATGPLAGVRLLFGGATNAPLSASSLEARLTQFAHDAGLGSQVLEDALCNWQKSPSSYVRFRG